MSTTPMIRIGAGFDTHRLIEGRPLILGGLTIPHSRGLDGHSDADVVLHSVTDAILGALALGDIGDAFPDTDPQWKGADSRLFLDAALKHMREAGYTIGNLDVTLFAQEPKLGANKPRIRDQLAMSLGITSAQVNVKAKTGERVGHIGRAEAIGCQATILLVPVSAPNGLACY
ncbi:MAG: 2-C-methyl-D-erythritol 2,4-cyclodiphosphate synthase [Fimbriiglobus sp.]